MDQFPFRSLSILPPFILPFHLLPSPPPPRHLSIVPWEAAQAQHVTPRHSSLLAPQNLFKFLLITYLFQLAIACLSQYLFTLLLLPLTPLTALGGVLYQNRFTPFLLILTLLLPPGGVLHQDRCHDRSHRQDQLPLHPLQQLVQPEVLPCPLALVVRPHRGLRPWPHLQICKDHDPRPIQVRISLQVFLKFCPHLASSSYHLQAPALAAQLAGWLRRQRPICICIKIWLPPVQAALNPALQHQLQCIDSRLS